jgi:hypothetical protein
MKKFVIFILCSTLFFSCFKKDDPIEKERQQMKEYFDNSKILVTYKGIKIALRVDYTNKSEQNVKISKTGLKALSAVAALLTTDTIDLSLSGIYKTYQQVKDLYELKSEINSINEDDLPTILSRFAALEKSLSSTSAITEAFQKQVFGTYNSSTEHFILGSLWFVTRSAPEEIYIYEAAQIDNAQISKADQYLFACLLKAVVCSDKEWYYTSEQSSTNYINYIINNKKEVLAETYYLDSIPGTDSEKRFFELRSLGYVIRAYSKEKSGRIEDANRDYHLFVDDFEKTDFDNKEMCFASAYICIRNSRNEQAEHFLKKIEGGLTYSEKDKETIAEIREFIIDKDNLKFTNYLDSFLLSKVIFRYIHKVSMTSAMARQLQSNNYSKKLVAIPAKVTSAINYSETLLNTDSLASKVDGFINGLLN